MKILDFIIKIAGGMTIYRWLFNWQVKKHCSAVFGEAVDLAGGGEASYYKYLPESVKIVKTNLKGQGLDMNIDLNQKLPFADNSVQTFFLFNAIYIIKNRVAMLSEIKRALRPGGQLFISSPFISNEMPDPHDYGRLTAEGLEAELSGAGFADIKIERFGERFTSALYLLHPFFVFGIIRLPVYALALLLDCLIPKRVKTRHPVPLGYFCSATKQ